MDHKNRRTMLFRIFLTVFGIDSTKDMQYSRETLTHSCSNASLKFSIGLICILVRCLSKTRYSVGLKSGDLGRL